MPSSTPPTVQPSDDFPVDNVATKCLELHRKIVRKSKNNKGRNNGGSSSPSKRTAIALNATGHQQTNQLVAFLQCQSKATKTCGKASKEYTACHQSFMGMGSYKGQQHCGQPLQDLYNCLKEQVCDKNDGE